MEDKDAAHAVRWLTDAKPSPNITNANRQLLKSEVGARAIIDLERWYERQWEDSRDFKAELIELLDASKFGRKEYTPFEVYMKALYEYFKDDLDEEQEGLEYVRQSSLAGVSGGCCQKGTADSGTVRRAE